MKFCQKMHVFENFWKTSMYFLENCVVNPQPKFGPPNLKTVACRTISSCSYRFPVTVCVYYLYDLWFMTFGRLRFAQSTEGQGRGSAPQQSRPSSFYLAPRKPLLAAPFLFFFLSSFFLFLVLLFWCLGVLVSVSPCTSHDHRRVVVCSFSCSWCCCWCCCWCCFWCCCFRCCW